MGRRARIKRVKKAGIFPSPALLPGLRGAADWHMKESPDRQAHTINQMGKAEMVVPTGDDLNSKYTRLHELLHAAHSPIEAPRDIQKSDGTKVSARGLMMAEEVRIDSIARVMAGKNSLPPQVNELIRETVKALVPTYAKTGNIEIANEIISKALACWAQEETHMGSEPYIVGLIQEQVQLANSDKEKTRLRELAQLLRSAFETIWGTLWQDEFMALFADHKFPEWDSVIELAEFIDTMYETVKELGKTPPPPPTTAPDVEVLVKKAERITQNSYEVIKQKFGQKLEKMKYTPPVDYGKEEEVKWGVMETLRPK